MRTLLPLFAGLALAIGSADLSRADDKYKTETKAKVEKDGDVKVKEKTKTPAGKHKAKTEIKHDGKEVKVKEKYK
jgi:hypothetical protein